MSQVISTILFNGQFWIALIEKIVDDGSIYTGKYTFGSEPGNTDLLDFYLNRYENIKFYRTDQSVRIKKAYSKKELNRNVNKSYREFKIEQKKYLAENKKKIKTMKKENDREKYRKKAVKKKRKKRGH